MKILLKFHESQEWSAKFDVSIWHKWAMIQYSTEPGDYRNISHTLVGNKIVDNSDAVGASPVGAAPTTFSFST